MTNKELLNLVKALQNNRLEVFDDLYYDTKNIVYYTILGIVKDPSLSEDLMQETYLKMLENIHSFKKSSSVKAWIATIARNLALNEYNKRKRELYVDISEDEVLFGSVDSSSEKELIVGEILSSLDDTLRDIVIYHVLGDLTFKEISKILDIPQGTIQWKYYEAIKSIQSNYERK